jgi:hypothetical protein
MGEGEGEEGAFHQPVSVSFDGLHSTVCGMRASASQLVRIVENTPIQRCAEVEARLVAESIQNEFDGVDVPTVFGLDQHTDDSNARDLKVPCRLSPQSLIHDQKGWGTLYSKSNGLRFPCIQVLTESLHERTIVNLLLFDPGHGLDGCAMVSLIAVSRNLLPYRLGNYNTIVEVTEQA